MCQQCPRTYLPAGNNTKITSLWSFLTESDERCNMCTTFIYCFISQGINSHLNQFLHRTNFTRQVYDLGQIQQLPLLSKLPFLGLCVRGSRHTEILLPIKIHYFERTVTKKTKQKKQFVSMNMTDYIAVLHGTDTWVSTPPLPAQGVTTEPHQTFMAEG